MGEKEPKERHIDISIPYFKKFIASKSKYFRLISQELNNFISENKHYFVAGVCPSILSIETEGVQDYAKSEESYKAMFSTIKGDQRILIKLAVQGKKKQFKVCFISYM